MKKILYLLLWLVALLLIVVIVKTLLFSSKQVEVSKAEIEPFGDYVTAHLAEAVTFPTVSYSEDSPIDTAAFEDYLEFIDRTYPLVNSRLPKEVFNRFSILYHWKGANASLRPVVLMAHYDVVPAGDTLSWENNPFSGADDGTYIWGRGTLDDKAAMISILEAVERLLREGWEPQRTIYLSFGHDEEVGGKRGAETIAGVMKDRGIHPEFVLDEGMAVTKGIIPMMNKPVALIGTSEKGYLSVRLSVEMPGGHSSQPEKESAIIMLNEALYKLVKKQMRSGISGPVNDFIRYVGPEMPFYARAIFANKWIFKGLVLNIYEGTGSGNALVRTTTAPTMLNAGIKDNIIPTVAEAVVNFRILPGETSEDVFAHIADVVGDERVKAERYQDFVDEPSPVSPADSYGFMKILTAISQIYPEAVVSPTMMLGASDSRYFSIVTDNIYRFAPIVVTSEDMARVHGTDERTGREDFKKGVAFFYRLISISADGS